VPVDSINLPDAQTTSNKGCLIDDYIEKDENDDFYYFRIEIDGYLLFFFHNKNKTNGVKVLNSLTEFLREGYGLTLSLNS
jgi:hypothetical protein